jgi:hypothetical protein
MGHLDDICSTIYNLQKGSHATYTKEKARLNWSKMSRNSVGHILAFNIFTNYVLLLEMQ